MNTEETTYKVIDQLKALKRYEITKYKSTPKKEVLEYAESPEFGRFILAGEVRSLIRGLEAASPALGGRSIQSEGPSASECEGDRPGGQRPDNQVLPQETTTQNIKTAEEILDHNIYPYALMPQIEHAVIKAMHAYAQQLIEADRKDCAEKARAVIPIESEEDADYYEVAIDQDSILNRPLPEMK